MPITPLKNGGWSVRACVHYRRRHRHLPPGTTARDAKRLEAELVTELQREHDAARAGDPSLTTVLALYLQAAKHLRSPDTAAHHAARIAPWAAKYTARQARQCAAHAIRDMAGHYKPATINRSLGVLKTGLRLAWEAGLTQTDYSGHIKRLPENNAKTVYLSIEEVADLADAASEPVRAAIWIGLLTGCRRGEVCKISAADIGDDTIRIQAGNTKTLRYRQVPILPALRPWLQYLPLPITFEGVKSGIRRARAKLGRKDIGYHTLRHSCATLLLAPPISAPLHVVRDILGHTSIKSTERYAHAMIEPQREALAKLGALHADLHAARRKAVKTA